MALYDVKPGQLSPVAETTFAAAGFRERADMQRLLRTQIEVVSPDTMVLAEEFGEWEDSSRRIDLLGLDRDANLVVVELKRTEDGGHMELQALRYAAMVSTMTFEQAAAAHGRHLVRLGQDADGARQVILDFLAWDEPDEDRFGQDARIVLVAADFSKEITSTVLWLNRRDVDIRCVRLRPYQLDGRLLVDAQQVIPLPEAEEYQVRVREKEGRERRARAADWTHDLFMERLRATRGDDAVALAEEICRSVEPLCTYVFWGRGAHTGGMIPVVMRGDTKYHLFRLRSDGVVGLWLDKLVAKPPFDDPEKRAELKRRLLNIPGLELSSDGSRKRFDMDLLASPSSIEALKSAFAWFAGQVREV